MILICDSFAGDLIADIACYDLKRRPDLLIVMGTSLKIPGLKTLVKQLSASVRESKTGKCVFVNRTDVGKEWETVFDYHVVSDCDDVVQIVSAGVKELQDEAQKRKTQREKRERLKKVDKDSQVRIDDLLKSVKIATKASSVKVEPRRNGKRRHLSSFLSSVLLTPSLRIAISNSKIAIVIPKINLS